MHGISIGYIPFPDNEKCRTIKYVEILQFAWSMQPLKIQPIRYNFIKAKGVVHQAETSPNEPSSGIDSHLLDWRLTTSNLRRGFCCVAVARWWTGEEGINPRWVSVKANELRILNGRKILAEPVMCIQVYNTSASWYPLIDERAQCYKEGIHVCRFTWSRLDEDSLILWHWNSRGNSLEWQRPVINVDEWINAFMGN